MNNQCLFLFQVIKLLEKELDSYKAKQAEPKPDVVSKQTSYCLQRAKASFLYINLNL